MYRKYYRYDDMGALAPRSPGAQQSASQKASNQSRGFSVPPGERITPQKVNHAASGEENQNGHMSAQTDKPVRASSPLNDLSGLLPHVFTNGKLFGKYEFDDILILFIVFLLLQDRENQDLPLLFALGYIFLSDSDLNLF